MAHDILIVDDEADIRGLMKGILEDEGFQVREAATSAAALQGVETRRPSLVLLDIWLGGELDGLGILKEIKRDHPTVPVLMMSGHGTIEVAVSAIKIGAYDFIEKPFKSDRLLLLIERAIEAARLKRENEELRLRAGNDVDLIGDSSALRDVIHGIERVAPANSRVLITGPAGAGKEVAARMIHVRSRRSSGPFVVLNCATLGPERFEEELFGVEGEGAGGGESRRRPGSERFTPAPCWTKSPTRRPRPRAKSSACCKNRFSPASGAASRCKWTSACARPRPATWPTRSRPRDCARICSTASTSCRW